MKPHKHAEVIKAWADGATIQGRPNPSSLDAWVGCISPTWSSLYLYRVKPEVAYPVTQMNHEEMSIHFTQSRSAKDDMVSFANAAIKHAIDSGQVCIKETPE